MTEPLYHTLLTKGKIKHFSCKENVQIVEGTLTRKYINLNKKEIYELIINRTFPLRIDYHRVNILTLKYSHRDGQPFSTRRPFPRLHCHGSQHKSKTSSSLPTNLLEVINKLRNVVGVYQLNSFSIRASDPLGVLPHVGFEPSLAVFPVSKPSPGSWKLGGDVDLTLTLERQENQVVWIEGSSIKMFARDEESKLYIESKFGVSGEISQESEAMIDGKRVNSKIRWVKI